MEMINGCTVVAPLEVGDDAITFGPDETSGACVLMLGAADPGQPGPPFHTHPNTDETFFVSQGELTCRLGDREVQVHSGGMVFIPRGTPHTAWATGDGPLSGILIISPGDVEHEFVPVEED
jgi:mannose-6-phosphate isomerase-like protein (cupin superfamily)